MIFPSAEKNFKKNSWNFRGFLFKIGFFVQTLINMTNQIPVISTSHNVTITDKKPSSLIGRGLIAIQRKETGLTLFEQDARYRQARDIYNRITHYGDANRFNADLLPNQHELLENPKLIQLQPFFSILQQLADVFIVLQQLVNQGYGKAYFPIARM